MSTELPLSRAMDFAYGEPDTIAPGIRRIVAENPGPMTFKGTNTYLIGDDELALIDPGPRLENHLNAILSAANGRPITRILLTHRHIDHVEGLAALKAATGATTFAHSADGAARGTKASSPSGGEFVDRLFEPDVVLHDGDRIELGNQTLSVVHTPGHAPDHLAFAVEESGHVFSGDHVMGWNTTVVAPPEGHMGDYFTSLEKLIARERDTLYLPGHGNVIKSPQRVAKAFLLHRKMRESAVLDGLRDGVATVTALTRRIYPEIDDALFGAAQLSVRGHVEWLVECGLARQRDGGDGYVSVSPA